MSKGIVETVAGLATIAAGVYIEIASFGALTPLATFLISAGSGMVIAGVGTMLSKGPLQGFATTTRNPVAPWNVVVGRARVGGTPVYIGEFGENDKYLDMVMVLACHPCEAVDALLFDMQRVQIGANNTSFTPLQQTIPIQRITRVGNVVTVVLNANIPLVSDGDQLIIQGVHPVSAGLNGRFPIQIVSQVFGSPGSLTFTYLSGGTAIDIPSFPGSESGQVKTTWPDYGKKVYMEVLLGDQVQGQTFAGMLNGTPSDGDAGNLIQNSPNPWTADCSLVGMTAVFLRLHYNDTIFANGLPQISFRVRGKKDILDPRTSPPTVGYTENAALIIADYLANTKWGFKATYGTEIPLPQLIAAANLCDEAVDLAQPPGATEPRYTCNGTFQLSMKRGEVLQNLLTSCGRLTYIGGQFVIWPWAWYGVAKTLDNAWLLSNLTKPFRWRPSVTISDLYNGVKGTFISPLNNWQSSDFPRYAQDAEHGYDDGPPEYDFDANLAADGGDRRWKDIQLPFTISSGMAQRLGKIELMRSRRQGTGTFPLNMSGYQFTPPDVLSLTLSFFGWADKYLEVRQSRFMLDGAVLGVELDLQETDPSDYAWDIGEELSPAGYQQAIVPDNRTPAAPTDLATFSEQGHVVLTWTEPADGYVLNGGHVEIQYQLLESPEGLWLSLGRFDPTITQATLPLLIPGEMYTIRIRAVNAAGVPSAWVMIVVTAPALTIAQWQPYQVQGDPADALFPNEWTFDVALAYQLTGDDNILMNIVATGKRPVTKFLTDTAPSIAAIGQASAGGSLPGGRTYLVSLGALDGSNRSVRPTDVDAVVVPGGSDLNEIVLSGIVWPAVDGLTQGVVFLQDSESDDLLCAQLTVPLTPGGAGNYTPTLISIPGPLVRSSWARPNEDVAGVVLKGRHLIHGGAVGAVIDAVSGNTVVSNECVDVAGVDNWTGRELVPIGRQNASIPFQAYKITAFDPATGTFTLDRPATALEADDVFVIATIGLDNSANPYQVSDGRFSNAANTDAQGNSTPHSGLTPSDPNEIGNVVFVIAGTSRGMSAKIVDNDATSYTLDAPIPIDGTSRWVVVEDGWPFSVPSSASGSGDAFLAASIAMPTANFTKRSMLIGAFAVDSSGNESQEADAPFRMIYVPATGKPQRTVTADTTIGPGDYMLNCDTSGGPVTVTLLDSTQVPGRRFLIVKVSDDDNAVTISVQNSGVILTTGGNVDQLELDAIGESVEVVANG